MNTREQALLSEEDNGNHAIDYFDDKFSDLLQEVLPFSAKMSCQKNLEVILGGVESQNIYYLASGSIEVSYTSNGTKIVVALIGAENFFGEIGFFDGKSRVRNIRVIENSEICVFDLEAIKKLKSAKPSVFGELMALMAQNIAGKFRRVLEERDPLAMYAASLSTGVRKTESTGSVSEDVFMQSKAGILIKNLINDYKSQLFDLSYSLQKEEGDEISENLQVKGAKLFDDFSGHLEELSTMGLGEDEQNTSWKYIFKETFPYMMRSKFVERAYFKPKGYAGDFLMIEMIYNNMGAGDGKIGRLVDEWYLNTPAAKAVRNRRVLLGNQLRTISHDIFENRKNVNIMNLACGPSRELFDFLSTCDYSESVKALCVDIDQEALEYTHNNSKSFSHNASIRLMRENLIKWCLNKVEHNIDQQDIIYSSGLMDYLDDDLFRAMIRKCYNQLNPGGVLIFGNFAPTNPIRSCMNHILEWQLIYRDEPMLLNLFEGSQFGDNVKIIAEEQRINLFAVATKN